VVGERTAGAVMAGRPFALSNRALLYLAVQDGQVDGVRLEGRGVAVDVEVADALPWAAGRDPQRERALQVAAERVGGS
jgi:carboxyl-terminal processing protease